MTRTIGTPQCVVAKRPNGTAYAAQGFVALCGLETYCHKVLYAKA